MENIKKLKIASLTLGLIVLLVFIYSIINYSLLQNQINDSLGNQVQKYGYIAVFILAFILEISPQPFASAIVPYTNGLILGLEFKSLLITTIAGVIIASLTAYVIGIKYGKRVTVKLVGEENFEKSYDTFKKYGKPGMALLALTPLPYFPIIGGLFKMNFKDFILFAIIPRIIHFLVFGYILFLVF